MSLPLTDGLTEQAETDARRHVERRAVADRRRPRSMAGGEVPRLSLESAFILGRLQAWRDTCSSCPLLLSDALCITTALALAWLTEQLVVGQLGNVPTLFAVAVVGMTLLFQHIHGLYPACGLSYSVEYRRVLRTCLMVCVSVGVGLMLSGAAAQLSWLSFAVFSGMLAVLLGCSRPLLRKLLARFDWWAQPVAIVGNSLRALAMHQRLSRCRYEGLRSVGIVFDPQRHWGGADTADQHCYLGPIAELESILLNRCTSRLVVADRDLAHWQHFHSFHGIPYVVLPTEWENHPTERTRLAECEGLIELHCQSSLTNPRALTAKRMLDLGLVGLSFPLWFPLMLCIGCCIKLSDRGPVFYRQQRVGRFGRPFHALKFRSMVIDADRRLREYLTAHPELHAEWKATHKLKNDPRITWIGRFLRKSSLDELPQLWNVLVGEMSLVGPRPIVDCGDYDREYIDEHPEVFDLYQMVRPGVTGLWQISGRNSLPYKQRVFLDRFYLRNWSITLDVYILWRTVKTALFREGAY